MTFQELNTQREVPLGPSRPLRFCSAQPEHLLLDSVKRFLRLSTDRELAARLALAPTQISKIRHKRHGKIEDQSNLMLSIHEETEWSFAHIRQLFKDSLA